MGIAGKVIQELEFAKDGEVGVRAERAFEFGQGCNFAARQAPAESLGIEGKWGTKLANGRAFANDFGL
jgi:hypothetical protein